jgi:hypothetical protein
MKAASINLPKKTFAAYIFLSYRFKIIAQNNVTYTGLSKRKSLII